MNKVIACIVISMFFLVSLGLASAIDIYGNVNSETNVGDDSVNSETSASVKANGSGKSNSDKESILARIELEKGLDITVGNNVSLGSVLRVYLSNGNYAEIRVLPETASTTAQANLNATCEENGCEIELKETGRGENARAVYEVEVEKDARIFGFMKTKMDIEADVDVETGAIVSIRKPWWAFLAVEGNSSSSVEVTD